ncbi:Gag [Moniliophthora roreri MCA 2997]|uniref:Gag n=1 Tax=Moniliophthora roreri (strain MCA 2997) TaxID=1381753 RepID=V2WMJ7_MONRO|nr:Gag [Moniliophthora roreri MCA 2997]
MPKGKEKEDVNMKEDKSQQPRYHFTSNLQEKVNAISIFNLLMNQPITLPVYQVIRNSPQLQKLIADATRTRREYVTKQAKYSNFSSFSRGIDKEDMVTSITMTTVRSDGETCHYKVEDLNIDDLEVIEEFLGKCANTFLKAPEVIKLFAMVTGFIEVNINGASFVTMINTRSELNVGSIDLPERMSCPVDFGE